MISPKQIVSTYRLIRPHIRRTPIVETDGRDFGFCDTTYSYRALKT